MHGRPRNAHKRERDYIVEADSGKKMDRRTEADILKNISRAIFARLIFIVHSITTIWQTTNIREQNSVWGFALISILILFEGAHTIIMRGGNERRWFCPSILLFIIATAPPILILEKKLCQQRAIKDSLSDEEFGLELIEQILLIIIIIGRWLLPKGDISSEQLSQILLAYLAISSDIAEFFDLFKEKEVWRSNKVQNFMLSAWMLSLLQFPFVLTVSRARKMRVALIRNEDDANDSDREYEPKRKNACNVFLDIDIWAIVVANTLQDLPFLLVRLYLILGHSLFKYTMVFFTCKNALIIALQTYRAFVIFNHRYMTRRDSRLSTKLAMERNLQLHPLLEESMTISPMYHGRQKRRRQPKAIKSSKHEYDRKSLRK